MEPQSTTRILWQGKPVLTTAQLAQAYNCAPQNINKNFANAKEYFTEGVHYFKLTGEELRQFKAILKQEQGALFGAAENAQTGQSKSLRMAEGENTLHLEEATVNQYAAWVYLWTHEGCIRHCKMINAPEAWQMFGLLEKVYFGVVEGEIKPSFALLDDVPFNKKFSAGARNAVARDFKENGLAVPQTLDNITKIRLLTDLLLLPLDSPFKEQLAKETANLILGKNIF